MRTPSIQCLVRNTEELSTLAESADHHAWVTNKTQGDTQKNKMLMGSHVKSAIIVHEAVSGMVMT